MPNSFLNYRTYDQLLAEIQTDFKKYYLEDYINPQEFIKVAKRCNYELGLKIFKTKEVVLDVVKGRAKLPNNFNVLNFTFSLSEHCIIEPIISGTHVEHVNLGPIYNPGVWNDVNLCAPGVVPVAPSCTPCPTSCGGCGSSFESCACNPVGDVSLNCKGDFTTLVQKFEYHTKRWTTLNSIRMINSPDVVDFDCPNKTWQSHNTAYIKNGFIYTSFKTGKLYVNYQGMLEDEDGNLLVPDHDMLNEFYEYAIKQRILENMIMNGEAVNSSQIQIIEQRLKNARNNAYSLVNTPNFSELRRIWEINRKAQYHNFYTMFRSY
jgi:hypothetical protein